MNPKFGKSLVRIARPSPLPRASFLWSRCIVAPALALVLLGSTRLPAQYAPYGQSPYSQPYAYSSPQGSYPVQPSPQSAYANQYNSSAPYGENIDSYPDLAQPSPQPAASQFFTAGQLEQMLAPVALYPDGLLAQVLAAATYPAQVSMADQWLHNMANASPDQVAAEAAAQNWDPSIKALTAFPQVLALLAQNPAWTTDLGNAYYNQTQDVLQTVQVLRQRAQAAGNLQSTPQEQVAYDQGNIELAPPDPQMVYVPSYNPWNVYGDPVQPYPGFSLLGALGSIFGSSPIQYGLGVAMSAFLHTPFGWLNWALDWLGNSILFNHSAYYSSSPSVAHWGGSYGLGYGYRHGGYGYGGHEWSARSYGGQLNQPRSSYGYDGFRGPRQQGFIPRTGVYGGSNSFSSGSSRTNPARPPYQSGYGRDGGYGNLTRPALPQQFSYNHVPARQQQFSSPRSSYGAGFYSNSSSPYGYGSRSFSSAPQQNWHTPSQSYAPRNSFSQQAFAAPHAYSGYASKPEHSGGFHLFGGDGSHGSPHYSAPKAPKMPKMSKGSGGGWHESSHSSGGSHIFGRRH